MRLTAAFLSLLAVATPAFAAFGVVQDGNSFVVDAGSSNPLVFKVSRSSCDITSIVYRGTEVQNSSPYSHIGSGLGTATVSAQTIGDTVKITCVTSTLTHYYVVRSGDSTIFMATYITAQPSIGELRYIARLRSNVVPYGSIGGEASTTGGSSSTVEGSDVFIVNGQTRSKFYSSERFIDDQVHCVYGDPMRVCMVIPNPTGYESSSGGPFFRDINHNNGGDYNALYFYMNSGHVQTEPYRMGLHGPYAMVFSRSGDPPKNLDTSFFGNLGIQGYVPASERGTVRGSATGIPSGFTGVVHWYNSAAQYWSYVSGTSFTSPPMKTGTYTMVLYKDELKVAQQTVSVSRGSTVTSNIASTEGSRNTVWRIGEFNGQPKGFRNADKQLRMHPSDSRMSPWGPLTYTVGNDISGFPMAQIKAVNNPTTIVFNLNEVSGSYTLRVGTTLSFMGARPGVTVNSWSAANPAAPTKIDSRGFTRGAYRGYGESYDFAIPSGTLKVGENKVYINVISGSSGDAHLSPNFIYDAVELFKTGGSAGTTTVTSAPTTPTTTSTTTPPPATTSAPPSGGTAAEYAQCGGQGYSGPTTCVSGTTCVKLNDWYSQCLR